MSKGQFSKTKKKKKKKSEPSMRSTQNLDSEFKTPTQKEEHRGEVPQ